MKPKSAYGSHFEQEQTAPRRQSITVDNIVLTRAQVEKAYVDINKPVLVLNVGDKVKTKAGTIGIVLPTKGTLARLLNEEHGVPGEGRTRILELAPSGDTYTVVTDHLVKL